jgi:hypothetical protein
VVISALEQTLGTDRMSWETAAVPDQPSIELRVTYDPARLSADDIVAAMKAAMEAHPDPAHPGPVRVALRTP